MSPWSLIFVGVGTLIAGCTLTSRDYEPLRVEGTGEAAAMAASSCAAGVECCAAVVCGAGEVCSEGSCEADGLSSPGDAGGPACDTSECQALPLELPVAPTCEDGRSNGDESDIDCGGGCGRTCVSGQRCQLDADCVEGTFCPAEALRCRVASCDDGVQNGSEVLPDCGGGQCLGCGDGSPCSAAADCLSGVCGAGGDCAAPTCADGVRNQDELDVDCGSACPERCETGALCVLPSDCESSVCEDTGCGPGVARCCQAPSCSDGVANAGEPSVDCGNSACGLCAVGRVCTEDAQCQTGLCQGGRCATPDPCNDGVQNGSETSIDCGGNLCRRCPDLSGCSVRADCVSNNCDPSGVCISCGDATVNGTETDVDCGGSDPFCERCRTGQRCQGNPDCMSVFCLGGFCT